MIIKKINDYNKKERELDLNSKVSCNLRSRTSSAFKSKNIRKMNKTLDSLGSSHSFFKNWIIHQLDCNMTLENCGFVLEIDPCLTIASFNPQVEMEMEKCCNWINLRPMYVKDNLIKGEKIDMRLYLLQEIKANYFRKLNAQEG